MNIFIAQLLPLLLALLGAIIGVAIGVHFRFEPVDARLVRQRRRLGGSAQPRRPIRSMSRRLPLLRAAPGEVAP